MHDYVCVSWHALYLTVCSCCFLPLRRLPDLLEAKHLYSSEGQSLSLVADVHRAARQELTVSLQNPRPWYATGHMRPAQATIVVADAVAHTRACA